MHRLRPWVPCLVVAAAALASWRDARADDGAFGEPAANAPATITPHRYTLTECLALADRNFPNLWAARARLAQAHGQLEEAKWVPWFQWQAQAALCQGPPLHQH